jgi:hypothetical protein
LLQEGDITVRPLVSRTHALSPRTAMRFPTTGNVAVGSHTDGAEGATYTLILDWDRAWWTQ